MDVGCVGVGGCEIWGMWVWGVWMWGVEGGSGCQGMGELIWLWGAGDWTQILMLA